MMKLLRKTVCLLLCLALCICSSGVNIFAEETENASGNGTRLEEFKLYLSEINVPDRLITLNKDLSVANIAWSDAGITKASDTKKDYENRGVQAAYCDPDTKELVYFITNQNDSTLKKFTLDGMTDDEIIEYAKTLLKLDDVEGAEAQFGVYDKHPQVKFFTILLTNKLVAGEELIYGTIANGMVLQFATDSLVTGEINSSFLEEIVQSFRVTRIMTYDEYIEEMKHSMIKLGLIVGGLVLMIVVLVILSKQSNKRRKKRNNAIAEKMLDFRKRRQSGEVKMGEPLVMLESQYSSECIDVFNVYNTWLFNGVRFYTLVILYLCLLVLVLNTGSTVLLILGIAVGVGLLYYKYSKSEKSKDILKKQLKVKEKPVALFRFYEEFFTVSGIDSISEYIYSQITAVKSFKNYLYIYMSEQHALIIDLNNLPKEKDDILSELLSGKNN